MKSIKLLILTVLVLKASIFAGPIQLEEIMHIDVPWLGYSFSKMISEGSGDLNGDGYSDFVLSKNSSDYGGVSNEGVLMLYMGKMYPTPEPDFILSGEGEDRLGVVVAISDINGDSFDDLIIGVPFCEPYSNGKVLIYFGKEDFNLDTPDHILYGYNYTNMNPVTLQFGSYLSASYDYNGDGFKDLVIGSAGPSMAFYGEVNLFLGGDPFDLETDFTVCGENTLDGYGVTLGGDINGDGFDDLFIAHSDHVVTVDNFLDLYPGGSDFPPKEPLWVSTLNSFGLSNSSFITFSNYINSDRDRMLARERYGKCILIIEFDHNYHVSRVDSIPYSMNRVNVSKIFTEDINGDNKQDLISCFTCNIYPDYVGSVIVYYGGAEVDTIPDVVMHGDNYSEYFGATGYSLGDINGDGNADIMLGSEYPYDLQTTNYAKILTIKNDVYVSERSEDFQIAIKNYPNPFNPETIIELKG
ncbi:MAG: FG-GAP repeat protein, partial [Candidatus Delongbacteria bacterium]|nr:FG-GAP repeat protein [Candidatus Delongbacteria bacterium]